MSFNNLTENMLIHMPLQDTGVGTIPDELGILGDSYLVNATNGFTDGSDENGPKDYISRSYDFDHTDNEYILFPTGIKGYTQQNDQITLATWVDPLATNADERLFGFSAASGGSDVPFTALWRDNSSTDSWAAAYYSPGQSVIGVNEVAASADWTFVCFTLSGNGGSGILYADGDLIDAASAAGALDIEEDSRYAGRFSSQYLSGSLAQIMVSNRFLSQDQVIELRDGPELNYDDSATFNATSTSITGSAGNWSLPNYTGTNSVTNGIQYYYKVLDDNNALVTSGAGESFSVESVYATGQYGLYYKVTNDGGNDIGTTGDGFYLLANSTVTGISDPLSVPVDKTFAMPFMEDFHTFDKTFRVV